MEGITLRQWAVSQGIAIDTARRYVREERISPALVWNGRRYSVASHAVLRPEVIGSRGRVRGRE